MRYLLLMVLATVLVCGGCGEDPCSGSTTVFEPSDFSAIADCTSISGSLYVICPSCTDLSKLDSLTTVGGDLAFAHNDALTDLDGLSGVTSVGGGLFIGNDFYGGNQALANLNGLGALTSVGGSLWIRDNDLLANLDGLSALTSVGWDFRIGGNDALTNLDGLSSVTSVGADLWIRYNDTLPDCEACDLLDQLTAAPTSINVHDNLDDTCTPVPTNCP